MGGKAHNRLIGDINQNFTRSIKFLRKLADTVTKP